MKIRNHISGFIALLVMLLCFQVLSCKEPPPAEEPEFAEGGMYYTGKVIDADTGKPVSGAQVRFKISVTDAFGKSTYKCSYGQTDKNGKYILPMLNKISPFGTKNRKIVIYKKGYVVYNSDSNFIGSGEPGFKPYNNIVRLKKWDDKKLSKKDHVRHVKFIGCNTMYEGCKGDWDAHRKFCMEAREEMILACMARYKKNPRTRDQCTRYTDDDLELIKKE